MFSDDQLEKIRQNAVAEIARRKADRSERESSLQVVDTHPVNASSGSAKQKSKADPDVKRTQRPIRILTEPTVFVLGFSTEGKSDLIHAIYTSSSGKDPSNIDKPGKAMPLRNYSCVDQWLADPESIHALVSLIESYKNVIGILLVFKGSQKIRVHSPNAQHLMKLVFDAFYSNQVLAYSAFTFCPNRLGIQFDLDWLGLGEPDATLDNNIFADFNLDQNRWKKEFRKVYAICANIPPYFEKRKGCQIDLKSVLQYSQIYSQMTNFLDPRKSPAKTADFDVVEVVFTQLRASERSMPVVESVIPQGTSRRAMHDYALHALNDINFTLKNLSIQYTKIVGASNAPEKLDNLNLQVKDLVDILKSMEEQVARLAAWKSEMHQKMTEFRQYEDLLNETIKALNPNAALSRFLQERKLIPNGTTHQSRLRSR
ncbi:hypothetical protein HDU82_001676 [Entophlyctis luteolus]|nr:hypothetical protein HDU82_001676 [Entophlyctis luteolus]